MIENEIVGLISNVGFPIVAFLLMWYQSNKIINKNTNAVLELTKFIERKL